MKVVFDASSLIILHQNDNLGLLNLILQEMNAEGILLSEVEIELKTVPLELVLDTIDFTKVNYKATEKFYPHLGLGERSVIEYTKKSNEQTLAIIDDKQARNVARLVEILFSGIMGLTARGFEICVIRRKNELIGIWDAWTKFQFRIPSQQFLKTYTDTLSKV